MGLGPHEHYTVLSLVQVAQNHEVVLLSDVDNGTDRDVSPLQRDVRNWVTIAMHDKHYRLCYDLLSLLAILDPYDDVDGSLHGWKTHLLL